MAIAADRSAQRIRIVAMGDSTTAGTPAFASPVELPPRGQRRPDQPIRLLAHAGAPRVGSPEPRRQRRAERPDPGPVRARRRRRQAGAGRADCRGQRRLPGPPGRRRHRPSPLDVRQGPKESGIRVGRWYNPSLRHRDAGTERSRCIRSTPGSGEQADADPTLGFVDTRSAVAAPGKPDTLSETGDHLHPSPAGYRAMAEAIRPVIEQILR